MLGLSEALWEELRPHGIGVTAVCPGLIDTPITRSARLVGAMDEPAVREQIVSGCQRRGCGPERVATNSLKAVQRDRLVAPISPEAWALNYGKRFALWALRWIGLRLGARSRRLASQG